MNITEINAYYKFLKFKFFAFDLAITLLKMYCDFVFYYETGIYSLYKIQKISKKISIFYNSTMLLNHFNITLYIFLVFQNQQTFLLSQLFWNLLYLVLQSIFPHSKYLMNIYPYYQVFTYNVIFICCCYGVNVSPQNSYVGALTLKVREAGPLGLIRFRRGHAEGSS